MTDDYADKLNAGQEYQDFIALELCKIGIIVNLMTSRRYQIEVGESISGIEIKYDRMLAKTGNLYIEIGEKPANANDYFPSGILRKDNTWLYVIGNYSLAYIFGKSQLQNYREFHLKKQTLQMVSIPTSEGFLITEKEANQIAIKKILFT